MKKIMLMIMILVPSMLRADSKVDFEIKLIGIQGQIDHYPLEFEMAFFVAKDIGTLEFLNKRKVSLEEQEVDQLNQKMKLSNEELTMPVTYNVITPNNPYFKPYPGFEGMHRETTKYTFESNGKQERVDGFQVSVRTDAWGNSSLSGGLVNDMIQGMVLDSRIVEKNFTMEDDGVEYHFSITRAGQSQSANETIQVPKYEVAECDGTCVIKN
jgi:hypothetical protein